MTQEVINKGTVAGDGTGETLFSAFTKINANFTELYGYSASALYTSAIGSTVQAYSANLSEYAAVNPTAAGLALLDDADEAAQRNTLGLGSAATANTGDFATAGHNHAGVYQPANANLTSYAGTAPTTPGLTLVGAADAAAQRAALSLGSAALSNTGDFATAGHNHSGVYQPANANLTTWAGVAPGTGVATALAVNVGSAGAFATNNAANSWTAQQTFKEVKDTVHTITDGAAFEIDPANGSVQTVTLGASRTPAATNFEAGQVVLLGIDDGTGYAITWTTVAVTWVKGGGTASAPALATTGYTWVLLWKVGSTIYGCEVGKP